MDKATIQQRLVQTAAGKRRHKHYKRTVERAKYYRALSTGDGIEEYMRPYYLRTDEATFQTLCRVTNQVTPSVINSFTDLLDTFHRSHARRELSYGTDEANERKTLELETMVGNYAGGLGVDKYLRLRLPELQKIDPNRWIIQQWKDFDNVLQYAQPYPFEASSEMALDFAYEVGDLQYLTVQTWLDNPDNAALPFQRLTCYQKGFAAVLTEINKKGSGPDLLESKDPIELLPGGTYTINGSLWSYKEYIDGLSDIKAKRAGYKRDLQTDGETYVWPWVAAEPRLNHSMQIIAELHFTAAKVAHPTTVRLGESCPEPEENGKGGCGGVGKINGHVCGICDGTGHKKASSTSSIEEVVFVIDPSTMGADGIKNLPDLSKMLYFVSPEVSILEWQEQHAEKTLAACWKDFTGNDTLERPNATQTDTATAKQIDRQKENNPVYEYGVFYAGMFEWKVRAIAEITGKDAGLIARIFVGKNLKTETIAELMVALQEALKTGNQALIESLNWDIARQVTMDSPDDFLEYEVQSRFDPFAGCTPEEKILKAESPLVPLAKRTLWQNLGWIFDDIEQDSPGFYKMPHEAQKLIVDKKVQEIIDGNNAEKQAMAPQITLNRAGMQPQIVN